MPATRVDFKEIRSKVGFIEVLDHYGIELRAKGEQLQGFCPLPNHHGKKKSPSFSVNVAKGIFQCFGCGAKGNILDFTALMEGFDPDQGSDIRKAALLLQERFLATGEVQTPPRELPPTSQEPVAEEPPLDGSVMVNAPLDFELKTLDPTHPYPRNRGLGEKTIETFGLGYCARGLMKGRLCIPLHDSEGRLIGYAGRIVDDDSIGADTPKYLLPGRRERDGGVYQFSKAEFLFNGFRVPKPVADLVVVEGFFGAMWLHQHGYHTVAVMGAQCSDHQAVLITDLVEPSGRVWIMPDGDAAGDRLAQDLFNRMGPKRNCRYVKLDGEDPEDLSAKDLAERLK